MAHDAHAAQGPLQQVAGDFAADKQAFTVPWGKAMMWIFLLSDTFIFSCFLTSYMNVRISTLDAWPNPSQVFALHLFGQDIPLILIAIMTFVLITSSGTMALAVNYGYRRDKRKTMWLLIATAVLGAMFVGMQAFEWTKLIMEGVRPWGNPVGRAAVRIRVLHDHGIPRMPRDRGRDLPADHGEARRVRLLRQERQLRDRRGRGPVLALRRSRLGIHLRVLLPVVRQHV